MYGIMLESRDTKRDKVCLWVPLASFPSGKAEGHGRCKLKYYRCRDTAVQIPFTCPVIKQNAGIVSRVGQVVVNKTDKNHRSDIFVGIIMIVRKTITWRQWNLRRKVDITVWVLFKGTDGLQLTQKWLLGVLRTSVIKQNDCVNIESKATLQFVTSSPWGSAKVGAVEVRFPLSGFCLVPASS